MQCTQSTQLIIHDSDPNEELHVWAHHGITNITCSSILLDPVGGDRLCYLRDKYMNLIYVIPISNIEYIESVRKTATSIHTVNY